MLVKNLPAGNPICEAYYLKCTQEQAGRGVAIDLFLFFSLPSNSPLSASILFSGTRSPSQGILNIEKINADHQHRIRN